MRFLRFGNRTIDQTNTWGAGIPKPNFGVDPNTKRLTAPADSTMSYDASGNLAFDNSDGVGGTRSVKRTVNGTETWQVYGVGGELVAEYAANAAASSPQKEYGYRNGQLLITADKAGSGGGGSSSSNSLSVNGTSAYLEAANSTSLNVTGSAITLEAWVKMPTTNTGSYQIILEKAPAFGTEGGYELCITDQGKARVDIYYGAYYLGLIGNTVLSANTWHHVAGVYNGSQLQVYVDGALDNSLSTSVTITSTSMSLLIGESRYPYGHLYFNGLIDEVRISNAVLYTANFTPAANLTTISSTKGLWKFDGSTPNDSSGNGNNGTLNGGATYSTDVPGGGGGGGAPQIHWLVTDQLGTPRMIFDQSGSLANVSRHDYLPFGEELFGGPPNLPGTGGRLTTQGYSASDNVRQKFTQKERDIETGLDYFEARYFSSTQGRFTSPDDFLNDTHPTDPAGWNLYAYVRNTPLRYVDPTGEMIYVGGIANAADRKELLRRANYAYGCKDCVTVDNNGFLAVNTAGLSQDVLKATAYLTDAINTNDAGHLFSVQVTNNNSDVAFGDSQAGAAGVQLPGKNYKNSAVLIRLDFGDDKWVSGDKGAKEAFLDLVFAHEVAHFYPSAIKDPADVHDTGPLVDAVNEIQQARGLLLRAQYGAFGRGASGDFVSVEFGKAKTDRAGNIVRNKAGGIKVDRTNKAVTWIRRTVGGKGIN